MGRAAGGDCHGSDTWSLDQLYEGGGCVVVPGLSGSTCSRPGQPLYRTERQYNNSGAWLQGLAVDSQIEHHQEPDLRVSNLCHTKLQPKAFLVSCVLNLNKSYGTVARTICWTVLLYTTIQAI